MTVFYRKYRPQKFADLVGQESIKETLLAQLKSGKISHGYLFAGPRGSGKTSTARIFAKAINCQRSEVRDRKSDKSEIRFGEPCDKCKSCLAIMDGSYLDLIEIDAASNRGIDEIRDLREKIKLSPISGRFKVYIIDEAHMLTTEAFNALLKTLEEPPAHAIFILCTTAANKLPSTIISRLSRFNFRRASDKEIVLAISKIAKEEKINFEPDALLEIAKIADGSFRDAVSTLDQLAAKNTKIKVTDARAVGGVWGWKQIISLLGAFANQDIKSAVLEIEEFFQSDGDISLFIKELIPTVEKLLLIRIGLEDQLGSLDTNQKEELKGLASDFSFDQLQTVMKLLLIAESEIKIYPLPKIPLILAACKICKEPSEEVPQVKGGLFSINRKAKVEDKLEIQNTKKRAKAKVKSLKEIEAKWGQFLDKVKNSNMHLVALLKSTRPVELVDDILNVEVFYRFHKDKLEEPKIAKLLEGFCQEIFGTKLTLKFVLVEKRKNKPPAAVFKSDVVDVSGENLEALAAEIFSK